MKRRGEQISVCLLTFNHVNLIESTIRTILNQTIKGFELIVSDDCSTDGTWEIICKLASEDPSIRAIRPPSNLGMAGNANFAFSYTERPYIALLHHDDLYRQDLLEKWLGVMERNEDVGFVFNQYACVEQTDIYTENLLDERIDGKYFLESFLFPRWGCPVRGTAMIRRKALLQASDMQEQFGLLADIDLWMRLSMQWAVGYVPEPVIVVRQIRPDDYPDMYKSDSWSWKRQHYLYEIHAQNRLTYYDLTTIKGLLIWWRFRWRLSLETLKWLGYGIVKRKYYIIATSNYSKTDYDLFFLRLVRLLLKIVFGRQYKRMI